MKKTKKNLKLRKFNNHQILTFIILTIVTIIFSGLLSALQLQATYSSIDLNTLELKSNVVTIENLLNYSGIKYLISNAARNFAGFAPLSNLIISLIGLSVAYSTGFIDAFIRRVTLNIDNKKLTFLIILVATISSLINDIGYVILIPLSALIFSANNRNPLLGIITSFCGVAFGYGATIFVGSNDINLLSDTTAAARLIDPLYHVELSGNLIIMIAATIIVSIVGTIVIEKLIAPKFAKISQKVQDENTKEIDIGEIKETEQKKLELESKQKKGLKHALIVSIIFVIAVIYMLIPGLPFSGLLLDVKETTYAKQVFGDNAYFQDGFTYMVSLYFVIVGLAYGIHAKTITNGKDLFDKCSSYLSETGILFATLFFAAQFIAVFKKTNIASFVVASLMGIISKSGFSGVPLILLTMITIAICGIFATTPAAKWSILSPTIIPLMMQSNISPQFAQFILRAADSMTKGITPLLAYFAVYICYMNIYNRGKNVITIKKGISYIMPYCLIIALTWILIIIGWYILGAPIGIGVRPSL